MILTEILFQELSDKTSTAQKNTDSQVLFHHLSDNVRQLLKTLL